MFVDDKDPMVLHGLDIQKQHKLSEISLFFFSI